MAILDFCHVRLTVIEDMGKGFVSDTLLATIRGNITPLGFILVSGNEVQSCTVNKVPITKSDVEVSVYEPWVGGGRLWWGIMW